MTPLDQLADDLLTMFLENHMIILLAATSQEVVFGPIAKAGLKSLITDRLTQYMETP